MQEVKAWKELVTIPTYEVGEPEKNPVFLEKRVYQGSSGVVYPHPVIEKISDEKIDKEWQAVFIENAYLKIMILPELGGRVQMAYDKVKQRHFVYYNQVIKPALVGLAGPWISGGIEFNWPQHHRPSTYDPVDFTIEENADGSKTVWCSEIERMFRTKGMAGFTLHPDKAYLEIKVKLYNRTPHAQTFLWWANPAVKVNDHYQSVFPPDVNAVFDHGKRDVSDFPIATGTYYKVNYGPGTDISRYKNIPVPTSYMAIRSDYDFIGCYEHDSNGGMLHVANHQVSPGKKQWTWGNGDFGYAWDRNLTDEDGPYIELMCGVYTDNQPDFSWLMPYEEKTFSQFFMPYSEIGEIKNATKEAALKLAFEDGKIVIGVYATAAYPGAEIILTHKGETIFETSFDLSPEKVFEHSLAHKGAEEDYELVVKTAKGKVLVSWKPETELPSETPDPAKAAKSPEEIEHIEQLFLRGLHLEQYRHATFRPADYYREALRRDPGDVRCNNAVGLLEIKWGNFEKAEGHFRQAIETLTERNPNPYDGEPYFNLGLALRFQYREDEAFDAFYKAVWNDAWQASGYFQLAQIATKRGDIEEALELIEKSLIRQWHNHKARHLKASLLRLSDQTDKAQRLIADSLELDRFNFGVSFEQYLLTQDEQALEELKQLMRGNIHSYIEIALDYAWTGLFEEALALMKVGVSEQSGDVYPLAWAYMGWFEQQQGCTEGAKAYYQKAEQADPGTCFPHQLESVLALSDLMDLMPNAAKAPYYLGNFFYHNRQHERATQLWEQSVKHDPDFPTVHRNLSLAYYNKAGKPEAALEELEKAFALDQTDARVFMELDALYQRVGKSYAFRLDLLNEHASLTEDRDDVYLQKIALLNFHERFEEAYRLIMARMFHPWEGGEGKVTGQYVLSLVEWAKSDIKAGDFAAAIDKLERAKTYPRNLGEGKLFGAKDNDLDFWLGYCHEQLGATEEANRFYTQAAADAGEPSMALYYNDQPPEKILYQGLALMKIDQQEEAKSRFQALVTYGEQHQNDEVKIDYFAVSLPDLMIWDDDLKQRNQQHCRYLMALGYLGLGEADKAQELFDGLLSDAPYHTGVWVHGRLIGLGVLAVQ